MRTLMSILLLAGIAIAGCASVEVEADADTPLPADNPVRTLYGDDAPGWTDEPAWQRVVSIDDYPGESPDEKFRAARDDLVERGGGVIYFPAGTYEFSEDVVLDDGIIIRGRAPVDVTDARDDGYELGTKFVFPRYKPTFEGDGTPLDTAFRKITLAETQTADNVGVVNIHINRGHIYFPDGPDHQTGSNRLVMGNIMRNTAIADPSIPREDIGQHGWQRWTQRHRAAIHVYSGENLFVANNRLPESGEENFEQPGYVLAQNKTDVHDLAFDPARHDYEKVVMDSGIVFDYDNRPGIYANDFGIGAPGDGLPNGTPESHPHGFRKGTIIRNNHIFATGRCPIAFCGDGTIVEGNVIRIPAGVWRPTCRGFETTGPGSTNDNRGIQCRGYRWVVRNNDIEVHSNRTYDRQHYICDGEGIMHENHVNSKVLDSKVVDNELNAYICIWRVEVDGLEIRGNEVNKAPSAVIDLEPAIAVKGRKRFEGQPYCPVRNLTIADNTVRNAAITVLGEDRGNIVIENNISLDERPAALVVENVSPDRMENNRKFTVFESEQAALEAQGQ
ncbi:MAG: hypothetical protein ACP5HU_12445 [Phycisphaerae bacterium]